MTFADFSKKKKAELENADSKIFEKLLQVEASCAGLSKLNALCVYDQLGRAPIKLKTKEQWEQLGGHIKAKEGPIYIWEPVMQMDNITKKMTKKGVIPTQRYDISQTDMPISRPDIELCETLLIAKYKIKCVSSNEVKTVSSKLDQSVSPLSRTLLINPDITLSPYNHQKILGRLYELIDPINYPRIVGMMAAFRCTGEWYPLYYDQIRDEMNNDLYNCIVKGYRRAFDEINYLLYKPISKDRKVDKTNQIEKDKIDIDDDLDL